MLKEERRQAYLQAMGLQVYYPRWPLSGARPSPRYELHKAAPLQAEAGLSSPADAAVSGQRIARNDKAPDKRPRRSGEGTPAAVARAELESRSRPAPVSPPSSLPDSPPTSGETSANNARAGETPLQLQLVWYDLGESLALLCEMPSRAPRQLTRECWQLLQAILRALSVPAGLEQAATARFDWPLHEEMSAEEASAEHASQALSGFITKHREDNQAANLLVFGEQVHALVPGAKQAGSAHDYHYRAGDYRITRTTGLAAMLAMPELKKDAWRQLQELRKRLGGTSAKVEE